MTGYRKQFADLFIVPYLPQNNFLNETGGAIQAFLFRDCLPFALVVDDLPLILPEREDEGTSGVGEGLNETVVLSSQYKVGAGAIPNLAFEFLMIPRLGGDITVTHQVAEIWTIIAKAKASITHATYFNFDVIDANHDHFQYQAWFNTTGGAAPAAEDCYDPVDGTEDGVNKITTQGKRELIEMDIQAAGDADSVAVIIAAAIDAKANVGAGAVTSTVTVTNTQLGAVMDAHDVDSGLTITISTQGRTKIELVFHETTVENMGYFGFHFQRDNEALDTIYEQVGCTIAEHTLEVESGEGISGTMKEDIAYMVAGIKETYGALTMLDKPRSYYGATWTKKMSPFGNKYKAHGWHTCNKNQTFTLSGAVLVSWFGWKILIENDLNHKYDGGGNYASGRDFNSRGCTITINVQLEDNQLYEINRKHVLDYGNDLLIQLKTISTHDTNIFLQFDCDKCRILPFEEKVNADNSPEQYDLDLVPAPGATFKYTLQTFVPNYAFGLGGE